ncbi:3-phosphoshikimate 1-carboxyvinyltransferase [Paucilactobacillus hokkaidonensis JCM 18461]|uniref:3-phosphoshikimate 1-carboxyvinyltransferase n=2 Tax=Paucilactobacillus hokkaidonensis TaxID=1193095 RepID=A0A0A1GW83_9LACO|nr:3-phosphoshikimate 1-carboxyvinyltransferase [Paucilactobacillus hokkaidonensis]KRO11119.1 3-phosphoshikimate 1-carboxyvinyltransferase [Paucilactobacillus hokkaidonensis]BAP86517.1 3-phosphoshikimate 1-carboxyvinyltransferase [Paucilactobacillus hokkaidonensis JCM 18461]
MTTVALPQNNNGLNGTLTVPGDKSISHRSVMFGAVSRGTTIVDHFLFSDDCLRTIAAFKALGVPITTNNEQVTIEGRGGFDNFQKPTHPLDMGNSGTSTRLLLGLLAKQPFDIKMVGDASLSKRPLNRVIEPLTQMGSKITAQANNFLPLTLHVNQKLAGLEYHLPVASAQVKSALIWAGLQADSNSHLTEKLITRDHTEKMLHQFGGTLQQSGKEIEVSPQHDFQGQHLYVPGDISSAAFFIVAGVCVPNSKITLKQVGLNQTRTGILDALTKMGAQFEISNRSTDSEPAGDITIKDQPLHSLTLTQADIPGMVDEVPLIVLAATQAAGTTVISGAQELRVKETDRIATVTQELQKFGADIEQRPDGFVINGGTKLHPADQPLDSHGDHRIGMMLAIANLIAGGAGQLENAEAINISYPTFWQDLAQLQA